MHGDMETGKEGGGGGEGGKEMREKGKRWGGQGGAREGAKIGWLMFYDTWFQLIYAVSCMFFWKWGVGWGGEMKMGRQGMGRVNRGGKEWLVDAV